MHTAYSCRKKGSEDRIIKNAKVFTSDQNNLLASALAVKDGKFVYVGDEAGLPGIRQGSADCGARRL